MAYFGRIVAVGRTVQDEPAVIYGISGRSEGSKKRKLALEKYEGMQCVHVREIGELTADQRARYDIFFYPAIVAHGSLAVVTNGNHTKDLVDTILSEPHEDGNFAEALDGREYEPDDYSTPRIAGQISWFDEEPLVEAAVLSKESRNLMIIDKLASGLFACISTYQGKGDEPEKPEKGRIWHQKFSGASAQELADELYNWLEPDKRVATGSAVMKHSSREWQLAVRNLHE
jgi:IMP cyclohydrolase